MACAAARAVESAKYAPSGPTRIAAPLPQEPCPSKADAAASGHGVPVRISPQDQHRARAVASASGSTARRRTGPAGPGRCRRSRPVRRGPSRPSRCRRSIPMAAAAGRSAARSTGAGPDRKYCAPRASPVERPARLSRASARRASANRVNDIVVPACPVARHVATRSTCQAKYGLVVATVLLVEDDHVVRGAMLRSLTDRGHAVHAVGTALDALRRVAAETPDLVVLDLGLPDLDGADALRMLRGITDVPIIIATARDDEEAIVRLLRAGADDYMVKPFTGAHLDARITTVLRRAGRASRTEPPAVHEVGGLRVDVGERSAAPRRRAADADPQGIRPAGLPRRPARPGSVPPGTLGGGMAAAIGRRGPDHRRSPVLAAPKDWASPRRSRATCTPCGGSGSGWWHPTEGGAGLRRGRHPMVALAFLIPLGATWCSRRARGARSPTPARRGALVTGALAVAPTRRRSTRRRGHRRRRRRPGRSVHGLGAGRVGAGRASGRRTWTRARSERAAGGRRRRGGRGPARPGRPSATGSAVVEVFVPEPS